MCFITILTVLIIWEFEHVNMYIIPYILLCALIFLIFIIKHVIL